MVFTHDIDLIHGEIGLVQWDLKVSWIIGSNEWCQSNQLIIVDGEDKTQVSMGTTTPGGMYTLGINLDLIMEEF